MTESARLGDGATSGEERVAYWRARDGFAYAVHELPLGVLDDANGATPGACQEMLEDLDGFDRLCVRLGLDDHRPFIDGCRWHFEHYPHYLGRRRHFTDYESYTRERGGPLRVPLPPAPAGLPRP